MAYITQTSQSYYDGNDNGNYQFTSLDNIINQFMVAYVGEDKIISKIKRLDVAFHAQRALQELSFDTFKSCKAKEFTVPATLHMPLPQDYVNYTKISWVDSAGIKHLMYPTSKTSNPSQNYFQDSSGDFTLQAIGDLVAASANVTLDDEYSNILVGMRVTGSYIPDQTFVGAVDNSTSTTIITLQDAAGVDVTPFYVDSSGTNIDVSNTDTTLTFTNTNNQLITEKKSYNVVKNLSWNLDDYKITASAAIDIANIKIGMLVYHDDFQIGTVVTNVSGTTIVVSALPDPTSSIVTSGGEITFVDPEDADTTTWSSYKSTKPSENNTDDYEDDTYWPLAGNRYGLDPQHAQANGSYYIDKETGKIHFSSNVSGKTVIIDYISDSLGTDDEMQVHKFAEEAMYKYIAYAILSTRANTQEYIIRRFKKERFAEIRKAKLRLSNIKLEEITQILRGKSKQIKH
tara:strand:+ start:536 stop:1909 length:1374 start_codon:yes stop_codon:yes gene_type:complete